MKVLKISSDGVACNSYLVTDDGKEAVIIDCGSAEIYNICENLNIKPVAVLLTHGHFDHVGGCGKFFEEGIPIYCGELEKPLIFSKEYKSIFGGVYVPQFEISDTFKDGAEVELAGIKFKVISTAGHTAGSVCYLAEDCLFTGDTLFRESIGRSDLPTGNFAQLIKSVKKLFALEGDYKVYCGHEGDTTLEYERNNNPYIN